ncbi:DUF2267 domain-containing protein (plasmid) [Embleya sp. NBC_00888]|uniref:DUF2267 domain-containing protein n=1 Tax=Embleya sp. NBC_00888 TaxID=2975960 RepID=UPI002F90A1D5|nr:DUF2267 domain-containing protein [Embleya sp. NBC_00888]
MHTRTEPSPTTTVGTYTELVDQVRLEGAYRTRAQAEDAIRVVLAGLGRQLAGRERLDLAARLPLEAALLLTAYTAEPRPSNGLRFVKDIAARTDTTPGVARWDTGSVLTVVATLAGADLLTRILTRLPSGWALLFGRAELAPAA